MKRITTRRLFLLVCWLSHEIRYTEPWESRTLLRLARELRELAANLPPQPRQEHA